MKLFLSAGTMTNFVLLYNIPLWVPVMSAGCAADLPIPCVQDRRDRVFACSRTVSIEAFHLYFRQERNGRKH